MRKFSRWLAKVSSPPEHAPRGVLDYHEPPRWCSEKEVEEGRVPVETPLEPIEAPPEEVTCFHTYWMVIAGTFATALVAWVITMVAIWPIEYEFPVERYPHRTVERTSAPTTTTPLFLLGTDATEDFFTSRTTADDDFMLIFREPNTTSSDAP